PVVDEDAPLWVDAPDPGWAATVRAVAALEAQVLGSGPELSGVVLRYGTLYGPGTAYARTGASGRFVRAGKLPLPEGGAGVTSFLHVEDAVGAAVAAVESEATGVFHITDDEPAPAAQWLPHYARALDAPEPPTIPVATAPRLLGWFAAHQLTSAAGASNTRAGGELGWKP
ncbi:NAD-dependent epimerase/dehydratase family protein, partial [Streptomyces sp. S6]